MYSQRLFLKLPYYVLFGVVAAISIEGPPLTTYSPCGSRLLYFIKQSPTQWNATLDVRLQHTAADIKLRFVDDVSITLNPEYADKLSLSVTGNRTIKIQAVLGPKQQIFTIKVLNERVPAVSELTVNDVVICNHKMRESQTSHGQCSDKCGTRSRVTEELFSVRTDASDRDWPWYAEISADTFFGGTIISATTVITSANFVHNAPASTFKVVAGTNVFTDLHHPGRQERQAIKVIVYPDYVYGSQTYNTGDIALIKVNEFIINMYVRPVCVSGPQQDSIVGETGVIVGIGHGVNNAVNDLKHLRSTDTIIRSSTECENAGYIAGKSIFCAGFGPTSDLNPGNGDGGGGLVIPTVLNGRVTWYLRGVFHRCLLTGDKCDMKKYMSYVDVAAYYEWIHWHIMFS